MILVIASASMVVTLLLLCILERLGVYYIFALLLAIVAMHLVWLVYTANPTGVGSIEVFLVEGVSLLIAGGSLLLALLFFMMGIKNGRIKR